ncbi:hypothetical protein [Cohnella soli]|uniref:Uncharacterized protein n=1 Tax=Cohnella soli TaxID=425005 RepID=A0ABW0I470_9BACL
MSLINRSAKIIMHEGQDYHLLYEQTVGFLNWTTAYHFDDLRFVHLLHRTENSMTGSVTNRTMYLHYNDVKRIFWQMLGEELIGDHMA